MKHGCTPLALLAALWSTPADAACVEHSSYLHRLAQVDTPGLALRIAAHEDIIVIADQELGFRIYDVSDPQTPTLLSSFDTWGFALDVELVGSTLYVADWITFQAFDLSNPSNPVFLDGVGLPGKVQGMAIEGSMAYIACGSGGFQIVDVANPSALTRVGSMGLPGLPADVVVVGTDAYVATAQPGPLKDIEVIDVSDPARPARVISVDAGTDGDNAERLATDGSFLYVAGSNLSVIDIRIPTSPVQIAIAEWPTNAEDVVLDGDFAYVADFINGLQVFDVSDPSQPLLVGGVDAPNSGRGVAVAGNLAFLALIGNGFQIYDRTNPLSAPLIGQAETSFRTQTIANEGDLAVVVLGDAGIQTLDISNPANPLVLGLFDPGHTANIVLENGLAYVNGSVNGSDLSIIDVGTDPAQPSIVGELAGIFLDGLAKVGSHVFSGSGNGIAVVNVSSPAFPSLVTTFPTAGHHRQILSDGTKLYASDSMDGLIILDVSNPAAPSILGSLAETGFANGLALDGTILWSSDGASGIQAVDVSNPANPNVIGVGILPDPILDLTVHLGTAYCTTAGGGVLVVNVNVPSDPTYVGEVFHRGFTEDVLVHEDHLYTAATRAVNVFALECAATSSTPWSAAGTSLSLSIFPNPVSTQAQVSFQLAQASPVRVSVFDIAGRQVRHTVETMQPAGAHSWTWNACDDDGRPLANGVYFVQLSVRNQDSTTKKMVLRR